MFVKQYHVIGSLLLLFVREYENTYFCSLCNTDLWDLFLTIQEVRPLYHTCIIGCIGSNCVGNHNGIANYLQLIDARSEGAPICFYYSRQF